MRKLLLVLLLFSLNAFAAEFRSKSASSITSSSTVCSGATANGVMFIAPSGSTIVCGDADLTFDGNNLSVTKAIVSTLATGTAPFTVASTTKVANLSVDSLDGLDSSQFLRKWNTEKHTSVCTTTNIAATSAGFGCIGEGTAVTLGTGTIPAVDTTSFARTYVTIQTKSSTPTSGDFAGRAAVGPCTITKTHYVPTLETRIATNSTIADTRIWVGFVSADTSQVSTSATNSAMTIAAFGYDTAGASPAADWQFCTSDGSGAGTTMNCTDTTLAVTASHEYLVQITITSLSSIAWTIKDETTSTTKTGVHTPVANLVTNTSLGWTFVITTLTGSQATLFYYGTLVTSN